MSMFVEGNYAVFVSRSWNNDHSYYVQYFIIHLTLAMFYRKKFVVGQAWTVIRLSDQKSIAQVRYIHQSMYMMKSWLNFLFFQKKSFFKTTIVNFAEVGKFAPFHKMIMGQCWKHPLGFSFVYNWVWVKACY